MSEKLLPVWIDPFVRESHGQYIHRSLWERNWLTNPRDVKTGMEIVGEDNTYEIQKVSATDGGVYIYYFDDSDGIDVSQDGREMSISVTTAEKIRNDPKRVIV